MKMTLAGSDGNLGGDHVLSCTQDGKTIVCASRDVVPVAVVKLSDKGQLVIPSEIRSMYGLSKGDRFLVRDARGKIVLEPLPRHPLLELRGTFRSEASAVELLLDEREKDRVREDGKNDQEIRA